MKWEAMVRLAVSQTPASPMALPAAARKSKGHLHKKANSGQDSDLTSREQIISLKSQYREQH